MFSRFFYVLTALFSQNTERSKGGSVVISHSLLTHGGQGWTCPYILLSLEASALLRQYTRSSLSTDMAEIGQGA